MKTPNRFSFSRRLSVLVGAALFAACPTVPPADELPPAPVITTFSVSQSEVSAGAMVTLTWKAEFATSVKIEELKLGSLSGVSGNEGTVDVSIGQDSLFVLTVRNERGASDTAAVAVRVGSAAGELLFTLLPTTISAGESATLAWSAPGASAVTLTAAPGGPIDVQGQSNVGVLVVSPASSTTYTLSANGRTATVTLTIEPTLLTFEASSLSADAGSTVTLSWSTANATRVQLTAPGRGTLLDTMDAARVAAGTFDDTLPAVVDPGHVFAYELTVTGAGVTLTDSLVVSINGNPAVLTFTAPKYSRDPSIGAFPDGGMPPASIRLGWTTREADSLSIAANGVEFYRAPANLILAGTVDLPRPSVDTEYQLTARATRGGSASKLVSVDVVGLPTVALVATPSSVTAGQPFQLSWTGVDVRNVKIAGPGLPLYTGRDVMVPGSSPDNFALGATTALRIDADNGVGDTTSANATVTVTSTFAVTSNAIGTPRVGQTVQLSWPGGGVGTGFAHRDAVVRAAGEFDDIALTGRPLTFLTSSDDSVATFSPADFKAPFFDREVGAQVWVSSNGYLSFSPINARNYVEAALPSAKLEPYSIAPNWDDSSISSLTASVYWEVKPRNGGQVLIVMWKTISSKTFEVKLYSNGQVDLEYLVWSGTPGTGGVQGPQADWGYPLPGVPASGVGMTFFGPKASPLTIDVRRPGVLGGSISPNGPAFNVSYELRDVVRPNELSIAEGLPAPLLPVGANGVWYELFNNGTRAIDLSGWGFALPDGGLAPLSGSLDAGATLVVGNSTDPSLNDDAGVQLVVSPLAFDAGTLTLAHDGPFAVASWAGAQPGVARVNDVGPFLLSSDTTTTVHGQTCAATASFGFQQPVSQLGTPGAAGHCGFPYRLQEIRERFFDISATGTKATFTDLDDDYITLSLAGAPFPFFGVAQTGLKVSTNGYVTFDQLTVEHTVFTNGIPETLEPSSLIAVFGDDLMSVLTTAGVYTQRLSATDDPNTPVAHWVIQWSHWSHYNNVADDLNFQLKLFDDGTAEVHFASLVGSSLDQYASGSTAVTWLENATGDQALVRTANSLSPGISPNTAFRFVPR